MSGKYGRFADRGTPKSLTWLNWGYVPVRIAVCEAVVNGTCE